MCGRYALALSNEEVYDALQNQLPQMFEGGRPRWERPQDYRPNYNIAPRQRAPIIHRDSESGQPIIHTMQWGLVPHWTKHPPTGPLNTINARSESLLDSTSGGMWHALKGHKRCVVPAQGYYEWLKKPSSKIAHFTRIPPPSRNESSDQPPIAPLIFFAGLWDTVHYLSPVESRFKPDPNSEIPQNRESYPTGNPIPLSTFTIMTTAPATDLTWLHDRMPCVLTGWEEVEAWLGLGEVDGGWKEGKGGTGDLLRSKEGLDCYPVPPEVGKIGTNSPTYIQPVSQRADGIKSFFQKQQASPAKPKDSKAATSRLRGQSGEKAVKTEANESVQAEVQEEMKEQREEGVKDQLKQEDRESDVIGDGIKAELPDGDEEKGLGDDSNAPNPEIGGDNKPGLDVTDSNPVKDDDDTPTSKRKRVEETKAGDAKPEKKGGRQTKVIRRATSEDGTKEQPAITSFFKSPDAKKASLATTTKPNTRKKGKR